ncbi:hypothetical protein Tco_0540806 [Tanacetum coccineum]
MFISTYFTKFNEPIVHRFVLDFYSQVTLQREDSAHIVISFMIQNELITLSLAKIGQILKIPYNGQAIFTNEWDLSSLAYFQETEGPYHTDLHTPDEIHQFLRFERVDLNHHKQTRRPQSDRGIQKARHSVSSSSTHHFGSPSHQENDDNNEGTSRASTPSPNSYLNSLSHLSHQT